MEQSDNPKPQTRAQKRRDWLRTMAAKPNAEKALAAVTFAESSFFPLPVDVMYVPMLLSRPEKAWRLALISTIMSVLGGIAGYALGYVFWETLGEPLLRNLGQASAIESWQALYDEKGAIAVFLAGVSPFPYKVITILSGALQMNFLMFVGISVIARSLRYFALAAAIKFLGHNARLILERHLFAIVCGVIAITISAFIFL